ncbi:hypothetical protein [Acinetobacter oleivorans]|uniref:hypothetical protein n=1 Tax=Acinetobacter oleivorans TaxID=1148157 RepID=UPI003A83AB79
MAAKKVKLDSRPIVFSTQGDAQNHYNQIAQNIYESKSIIHSGQDFEELKEIFIKYCQYTNYESGEFANLEIIGFKGVQTVRENYGKYITTICFSVIFSNQHEQEFSVRKAIADYQKST